MLIEVSKTNRQPKIISMTESELQVTKNVVILTRGVNKIMYNRNLQLEIISKFGLDDKVYIMIPEEIRDDKFIVNCSNKKLEISSLRNECINDTNIVILCKDGGK